jgi:hypothetical protein
MYCGRGEKCIFLANPEGNVSFGRPRPTWKGNSVMNLKSNVCGRNLSDSGQRPVVNFCKTGNE